MVHQSKPMAKKCHIIVIICSVISKYCARVTRAQFRTLYTISAKIFILMRVHLNVIISFWVGTNFLTIISFLLHWPQFSSETESKLIFWETLDLLVRKCERAVLWSFWKTFIFILFSYYNFKGLYSCPDSPPLYFVFGKVYTFKMKREL